jgi:hypothetical protein
VGLVLEAPTQTSGVPDTAATWVAPTGTPATPALGYGKAHRVSPLIIIICTQNKSIGAACGMEREAQIV